MSEPGSAADRFNVSRLRRIESKRFCVRQNAKENLGKLCATPNLQDLPENGRPQRTKAPIKEEFSMKLFRKLAAAALAGDGTVPADRLGPRGCCEGECDAEGIADSGRFVSSQGL